MTRIKRNTGKSLEAAVELAGDWYRSHGLAWFERVEPPVRWTTAGTAVTVRPALADFLGAFVGQMGYMSPIAIECKSISGRHDHISLFAILKNKPQRERLAWAANFWWVRVVFDADIGRGMQTYSVRPTILQLAENEKYYSALAPCGILPNGAPDILNLRNKEAA
jgi:hypothetical protein